MYYSSWKLGVAIAIGLSVSVGSARSIIYMSETKGNVVLAQESQQQQGGTSNAEQCKVTREECLTINDDPGYCSTNTARGRMMPCTKLLAPPACYVIAGSKFCKQ